MKTPELPEHGAHDAARESIRQMSPEQKRETLIKAGILKADGTLEDVYRDKAMKTVKVVYTTDGRKEPTLGDYQELLLVAITRDEAANLIAKLSQTLARTQSERHHYINFHIVAEKDE